MVLAELGDYRGYDLAAWQVKDGAIAAIRCRATDVLSEIAKLDEDTLMEKKMEPVATLAEAAKVETKRTAYIAIVMAAEKLRDKKGEKILEAAGKNAMQAGLDIQRVNQSLSKIKKELASDF